MLLLGYGSFRGRIEHLRSTPHPTCCSHGAKGNAKSCRVEAAKRSAKSLRQWQLVGCWDAHVVQKDHARCRGSQRELALNLGCADALHLLHPVGPRGRAGEWSVARLQACSLGCTARTRSRMKPLTSPASSRAQMMSTSASGEFVIQFLEPAYTIRKAV